MLVRLDPVTLILRTDSPEIRGEWEQLFAPFRSDAGDGQANIQFHLELTATMPSPPSDRPSFSQPGLTVYVATGRIIIHLPGLGQLRVDPFAGRVAGEITPAVMDTYGVFEDITAMALAPLLRRRGLALIHAFAAEHHGRALLLVGENASGKTTTGLALLSAGWKLLANDSPMLALEGRVVTARAYPGRLSIDLDGLRRLPALPRGLAQDPTLAPRKPGWKLVFPAERCFEDPWGQAAPVGAICVLELNPGAAAHRLELLSPALALGRLLPHSVDRWDQPTLAFQIDVLEKLAQQAPAYLLRLGPDVPALPGLLERLIGHG